MVQIWSFDHFFVGLLSHSLFVVYFSMVKIYRSAIVHVNIQRPAKSQPFMNIIQQPWCKMLTREKPWWTLWQKNPSPYLHWVPKLEHRGPPPYKWSAEEEESRSGWLTEMELNSELTKSRVRLNCCQTFWDSGGQLKNMFTDRWI